jgi:putative ABC transport system ATP-binding protein
MRAVEVSAAWKSFGTGPEAVHALRGVDFHADGGEMVMISGPSGSGKTTLLSLIGCILRPSRGEVRLLDSVVSALPEGALAPIRLSHIGFVFQSHNLIGSLTAAENVALMLQLRNLPERGAGQLLELVGMSHRADAEVSGLSGGERQRVAIARAVAGSPPIILADEPTASLDAKNGTLVCEILRRLAKDLGHAVVVVTHDPRVLHLADRRVNIEDGVVTEVIA